MRRTTIYLDADQEIRLKTETQRQGRPMAELIREAITEYLATTDSKPSPGWGQFESGTTDTAMITAPATGSSGRSTAPPMNSPANSTADTTRRPMRSRRRAR